jgi:hypothetical protein
MIAIERKNSVYDQKPVMVVPGQSSRLNVGADAGVLRLSRMTLRRYKIVYGPPARPQHTAIGLVAQCQSTRLISVRSDGSTPPRPTKHDVRDRGIGV